MIIFLTEDGLLSIEGYILSSWIFGVDFRLVSQVLKKMKGKMPEMAVNHIVSRAMQV